MLNLDAHHQTEKIMKLHRMRKSAVFYRHCFKYCDNPEALEEVRQGYMDLLDAFYAQVSDYMPLQQYHAAERDAEYLIRLIDLALAYFIDGMDTEGQVQ